MPYYDRKVAEGKVHKEALRALKRRISDALFAAMVARRPARTPTREPGRRPGRAKGERLCSLRGRLTPRSTGSSARPLPGQLQGYASPARGGADRHPWEAEKSLPGLLTYKEGSLWDRAIAGEAQGILEGALAQGPPGPYQLQAAIAACHSSATDSARTDWAAVEHLYRQLGEMTRSPVVGLNWPVALAMVKGPQVGLEVTERLVADGALVGYYLLAATRADFLLRLGRCSEAAAAYRGALALVGTEPERRFVESRLAEVAQG